MRRSLYALLGLTSLSLAYPAHGTGAEHSSSHEESGHATNEWSIHESCNATETRMLRHALAEMVELAEHAKLHVLRHGNGSAHYQKYFGSAPSGEVIGWLEKIVHGDRSHALFRCDNPDGNCDIPTYGGHWRGANATNETVICPLSYQTRNDLEEMCMFGYNVAEYSLNFYFASDLLHRLYHIPSFGEGWVEHYAETYEETLELARSNASYAVHDSDSLQYFALEVYAYEVAIPGVGCPGPGGDGHSGASATSSAHATSTHDSSMTTSAEATGYATAAVASPPTPQAASQTSGAPQDCHTDADGSVHCT